MGRKGQSKVAFGSLVTAIAVQILFFWTKSISQQIANATTPTRKQTKSTNGTTHQASSSRMGNHSKRAQRQQHDHSSGQQHQDGGQQQGAHSNRNRTGQGQKKINKRQETTGQTQSIIRWLANKTHTQKPHCIYYQLKQKSMLTVTLIAIIFSKSFIAAEPMADNSKHFTIFDAVGQMASGMAYVHVAIPFNLTTFNIQSEILGDYLFKLSRVVDSNETKRDEFLSSN